MSATHDTIAVMTPTGTTFPTELSVGIAAVSAIAAAMSARASSRGVALSHRPFVVGKEHRELTEILPGPYDPQIGVVGVRLRNEGPGVALGVRYRMRSWSSDAQTFWSPAIDSLPPGEELTTSLPFDVPSGVTAVELRKAEAPEGAGEPNYVLWYVETQFSDITGTTWLVQPGGVLESSDRPRRVRSHRFQLWRPNRAEP